MTHITCVTLGNSVTAVLVSWDNKVFSSCSQNDVVNFASGNDVSVLEYVCVVVDDDVVPKNLLVNDGGDD